MNTSKPTWKTILALAVFMGLTRVIPHPWNFAPMYGACLYLGATLPKRHAFGVILLTTALADILINFLGWHPYEYSLLHMSYVYGAYLLIAFGGQFLRKLQISRVALGGLSAALAFFLVTNFGMWLVGSTYPHTAAGLALCFTMALPFLGNTLISSLLYTAVFFGAHAALSLLGRYPLGTLIQAPRLNR